MILQYIAKWWSIPFRESDPVFCLLTIGVKPLISSRNTDLRWLLVIGICRMSADWNYAGAYIETSETPTLISSC